jgi:hypothetical protein
MIRLEGSGSNCPMGMSFREKGVNSSYTQSLDDNQILIDLTGIAKPDTKTRERYEGIGW